MRAMQQEQEIESTREKLFQMPMPSRGLDGQRAYDPMTAPQPNAFSYRISEDDPLFPNKKWNCGDTDCCNDRIVRQAVSLPQQVQKCEACPCVEPPNPGVSPNASVHTRRLLM